ncbi:MAG TPA: hypothetical protein VMG30_11830 [Acidobacteriota bacterium]|nr:hypothetical protein [Acidobacteriota bacterium]
MKEIRTRRFSARKAAGWSLATLLATGFLGIALSTKNDSAASPLQAIDKTIQCGKCKITVIGAYCWRDWMPVVAKPGPDGGSPLHARVKLTLDNSAGDPTELGLRAAIVDGKGQSYPLSFGIRRYSRPFADDVSGRGRISAAAKGKSAATSQGESWNGNLNRGEVREVELVATDGPFLPAGSRVRVWMEWTDKAGNTAVITTPDFSIERTD